MYEFNPLLKSSSRTFDYDIVLYIDKSGILGPDIQSFPHIDNTLLYGQLHNHIKMLINHILLERYTRWIDLLCSVAASKIIDIVAVELSTTDGEHVGSLSVDGNADPRGQCARTEWQMKPSWRLQLVELYIIRSVTIFTPECCRRFITN